MAHRARFVCLALLVLAVSRPADALAVNYDEGIDGDLSDLPANPTSLGTLSLGGNGLSATSGGGDFDLITLSIGNGHQLASIVPGSYSGPSVSFIGMQGGTTWTEGLQASIDPQNLLGWTHFGSGASGSDILDDMATAFGVIGFQQPLPAGDYVFLLQDTGGAVSYDLTFNVVPEPSSMALAGLGGLLIAAAALRTRLRGARH